MTVKTNKPRTTDTSLIALAKKLFGEKDLTDWVATLIEHFQNDPPFTKAETKLRENRTLTPKQGGMILLEFALDETFRGILGMRKGATRKKPLNLGQLADMLYRDAHLVIEPPANAVTMFRGERIQTRVEGIIGINCAVFRSKDVPYRKVRCRFVSHPFWQLGVSNIEER
jgi:hypothetical protein